MAHAYPDPARDGTYKHFLPNGHGKCGSVGIDSGLTPKIKIASAGSGVQIVAADGVTVLLDCPETGYHPPASIPDQAADPIAGSAKQIYWHTGESALKWFDGTTAQHLVVTP
jgi:hypothetical protein